MDGGKLEPPDMGPMVAATILAILIQWCKGFPKTGVLLVTIMGAPWVLIHGCIVYVFFVARSQCCTP